MEANPAWPLPLFCETLNGQLTFDSNCMEVMIRRLTEADAVAFRNLRLQGLGEKPDAFGSSYQEEAAKPLAFFAQRAQGSADAHLYGAWHGEQLVGITSLVRETQTKTRHKANIYSVYVAPQARGQGIARRLMAAVSELAATMSGLSHLYLTVTEHNLPAMRLYQSLGFEAYGVEPAALRIDQHFYDEVLMCKALSASTAVAVQ